MGDITVEDQSGEESAEDALDADERGEGRTEEHDTQHKDILHHGVTITAQEVARQLRDEQEATRTEGGEL